jgi:hypothetical protein
MTKMFEKKAEPKERNTINNKMPDHFNTIKEMINCNTERASNNNNLNNDNKEDNSNSNNNNPEEAVFTSRPRASSFMDKLQLFNKNSTTKIVKKDLEVATLPVQNYKKVIDEQTKKVKWVQGEDPNEGMVTSRTTSNKPEIISTESESQDTQNTNNTNNTNNLK